MELDAKKLISWLQSKIVQYDNIADLGSRSENITLVIKQAFQEVLDQVKQLTTLSLHDLNPGDFFRFAPSTQTIADGDTDIVFLLLPDNHVLELNRNIGESFELNTRDYDRPVIKITATFEEEIK